jgi:AraC-like DNA-binding protein
MVRTTELLRETNYTLQTTGEMVDYSEGNNFQTAFKAVVGKTRGNGREQLRVKS